MILKENMQSFDKNVFEQMIDKQASFMHGLFELFLAGSKKTLKIYFFLKKQNHHHLLLICHYSFPFEITHECIKVSFGIYQMMLGLT